MKVLLIDDDPSIADAFSYGLEGLANVSLSVAPSRASGLEELPGCHDLIICDLKMPSEDGGLDADAANGLDVFRAVCVDLPATPVIVLSGWASDDLVSEIVESTRQEDLTGSGIDVAMRGYYRKGQLDKCIERVKTLASDFAGLESIEVATGGADLGLAREHLMALRIICRRLHGTVIRVDSLDGGRSDAKTLRAAVSNAGGNVTATLVVKIDEFESAEDESARCAMYVIRLNAGAFAPHAGRVTAGTGRFAAGYYTHVAPESVSFYEWLRQGSDGEAVIRRLRENTGPWHEPAQGGLKKVGDVRRQFVDDEGAEGLLVGELAEALAVEDADVYVKNAIQHGDLHGGNVLVAPDGRPLLIDYGKTDVLTVAVDPVTLELSLALGPDRPFPDSEWPSVQQMAEWDDMEAYLADCPYPAVIRQLRGWAYDVAHGDREVLATAYSYAVRQLKYAHDTDPELASAAVLRMSRLLRG